MSKKEDILEEIQMKRCKTIMERMTRTVWDRRRAPNGRGMEHKFGNVKFRSVCGDSEIPDKRLMSCLVGTSKPL